SISGAIIAGGGMMSPDQPERAAAAVATALPLLLVTLLLAIVALMATSHWSASETLAASGDWPRSLDPPLWIVLITLALTLLNIGVPIAALMASLRVPLSATRIGNEFG